MADIDISDFVPTAKFAYLKKMLEPIIRTEVDALLFSGEGHERAKNVPKSEYGKQSEIANACIQNIMNFPVITVTKPTPVHESYKILLLNV